MDEGGWGVGGGDSERDEPSKGLGMGDGIICEQERWRCVRVQSVELMPSPMCANDRGPNEHASVRAQTSTPHTRFAKPHHAGMGEPGTLAAMPPH